MADIEVAGLVAKLSIDDSDLEQSMASLNRQMRIAKSEFQAAGAGLDGFGKGTDGLKNKSQGLTKQLDIQAKRVAKLQEEHAKSVEEKGKDAVATQKLETQLNKSVAEYNKLHGELQRVNKELAVQSSTWTTAGQALEKAGGKMQSIGKGMESAGKSLTKNVTLPLVAAGGLAFKTAMDYESAFAGVIKTVDATDQELAKLSDGIRDMAKEMPMAATEIAGIAEAAGQLGIEVPNIMGFTKVMADLGVATNMSAETAATSLARLANITQMPQTEFDRLGSTTVALGNALATTESEIVEMGLRIAGAGKQVGMSEAQILSFAGALSSVGIEAQAGGSSISRLMVDMQLAAETGEKANKVIAGTGYTLRGLEMLANQDGKAFKALANDMGYTSTELTGFIKTSKRLEQFSSISGKTAKEFQKAFGEDAAGAVIEFIKGLSTAEERGLSAIAVLDDMGITEIRLRDALLRAANAGDLFNNSIEMGTKAWQENTALQDEAAQRYKTTESQLQILKNRATDVGITLGQELIPAAMDALEAAEPLFKAIENGARAFSEMDTAQQRTILKWAGIALAAGPVLSITGKLTTTVGGLATGLGKASQWIGSFATASKGASIAASGVASATSGAAGATAGFASLLNPLTIGLGVAALAVGGLVWAYKEYKRPAKEAGEAGEAFAKSIAGWDSTVNGATSALEGFNVELIYSSEKMNTLESNIRETQTKIMDIAKLAAEESRAYTEAERKELEELTGLLAEYTAEKMEMLQQRSKTTRALVEAETEMSVERASQLAKAEQDTREMIVSEADKTYTDRVALAEKTYGHLGELDKASYDEAIKQARQQRDERIAIADEEAMLTLDAIQRKYADQHAEDMKYIQQVSELGAEYQRLEKAKSDYIEEQTARRIVAGQDGMTQSAIQMAINVEAWWKYDRDIRNVHKELTKSLEGAEDANLGAWIGMLNDVVSYGGDITDENRKIVQGILSAFDGLPADAQKALESVMDGMIKGINNKQGAVFKKASGVAQGVLDRTRSVYQIQSPSKAMEKIYEQLFEGSEKPMKEASQRLPKEMQRIADDMLTEAQKMIGSPQLSRVSATPERVGRIASDTLDMSRPPALPSANPVATSSPGATKTTADIPVSINIQNMHVRNEGDIDRIAKELQKLLVRRERGLGMA